MLVLSWHGSYYFYIFRDVPVKGRIRLLDVGSCFNPFLEFEELQAVGIDISPATEVTDLIPHEYLHKNDKISVLIYHCTIHHEINAPCAISPHQINAPFAISPHTIHHQINAPCVISPHQINAPFAISPHTIYDQINAPF
jgi:hypothetical protein